MAELFVEVLLANQIQPSMDGKGGSQTRASTGIRAIDNIFVERLWRSVKYEDIYLKSYQDGWQLEQGMEAYFHFYNQERAHQSLNYQTPQKVYHDSWLIGKGQPEKANSRDN